MDLTGQWADTLLALERLYLLKLTVWGALSVVVGTALIAVLQVRRLDSPLLGRFGLVTAAWGLVLVDIAKHVAHAYARRGGMTANQAFSEVLSGFIAEIGQATDEPTPTEPA